MKILNKIIKPQSSTAPQVAKEGAENEARESTLAEGIQKFYRRIYPAPPPFFYPEDKTEYIFKRVQKRNITVYTEDDRAIIMTNKSPHTKSPNRYPVFCIPGLAETRFVLDQALGNSFVDYLALNGFDVYVVELRGHGKSRQTRERYDWNVQTFLKYDVPACLNRVLQESGQDKVLWVGHSMGGMLLLAYLIHAGLAVDTELYDPNAIQAGVLVGSPVIFNQLSLIAFALLYRTSFLERLPFMPTSFLSNLLSMFGMVLDSPLTYHFWNYRNMEHKNKILYLKDGLDNISQGVMRDFMEYILKGDFVSSDGKINYRENLYLVQKPLLIVSGSADPLATPESAGVIYDNISSQDKELRVFGTKGVMRRGGQTIKMKDRADYGHVDLTLGINSREDIWPYMLSWLRKRARVDGTPRDGEEQTP